MAIQISVVESKKARLEIQISGSDHTIGSLLVDELWNDKATTAAAYTIDHPQVGIPKLILETDGKDPKTVLSDAIKRLQKQNKEFVTAFQKA